MRAMADTNVFDFIAADVGLLQRVQQATAAGVLVVLTTHVQEDELAAITDLEKRVLIAQIPRTKIPTEGFVVDVSRLGEARLSEGTTIEALRRGNWPRYTKDALIGATAQADANVLVTNDETLTKRAKSLDMVV